MKKAISKFISKVKNAPIFKRLLAINLIIYTVVIIAILVFVDPQKIIVQFGPDEDTGEENLPETGETRDIYKVSSPIQDTGTETLPIDDTSPMYGLSIDAEVSLPNPDSYVRTVLFDEDGNEYLIQESYLLLDGTSSFSVTEACEETCYLDGINVSKIQIETENGASINITNVNKNTDETTKISEAEKDVKKEILLDEKVGKLNREILKNNLNWQAGKTSFSRLSYAQKNRIFDGKVPNFNGLEFYKGGVYKLEGEDLVTSLTAPVSEVEEDKNILEIIFSKIASFFGMEESEGEDLSKTGSVKSVTASSLYVDSWDWRNKHGADNPSSPYFDGNPDSQESGNGWLTSVKNQGSCGSCWAFAATGATEALVNLYYNQHINLNLAEQDALSCSGAGSCSGGWPGVTLDYYTTTGVVNESCFPYTATDQSCSNKCSNPSERIRIGGKVSFTNKTEDNLKNLIIQYGPVSGGIYSWSHAMTLLGWYTDGYGDTVWIFKNSWGRDWGENGYLYLKTSITNIGWTHALINPIIDSNPRTISCIDADGDGYYNWGISEDKPASCPDGIPDEKDCNDFDPSSVVYDESYNCTSLPSDIYFNTSNYNYQKVPVNQTSQAYEITIGNRGEGDLSISNIALMDTENFTLDLNPAGSASPCGQIDPVISPGGSCSFAVSFTPKTEASYQTNILIASSDEISPSSSLIFRGTGTYDGDIVCPFFDGIWIEEVSACLDIPEETCINYRGTINPCISYCAYGYYCTQQCVESCEF